MSPRSTGAAATLALLGQVGGTVAVGAPSPPPAVHVRLSQAGFGLEDTKTAIALSTSPLPDRFSVLDESGRRLHAGRAGRLAGWGSFGHQAVLDFSAIRKPGRYRLALGGQRIAFEVGPRRLHGLPDVLLEFLRQQRCGYNPFLDAVCHAHDGRSAFGPLPAGSYLDARGGWHDAADQLKYLLTTSTATAHLLLAHRAAPHVFGDAFDGLGRPSPNGLPDVLDEARWGLEWMLRLHPTPDALYHQVADDRDHLGWKLPPADPADYGWGPGRERVVYFADGAPQGLGRYQSTSSGIANLAGRYAAAMALAHQTWKDDPRQRRFAEECLSAGVEVYGLGRAKEGVQQGNSYGEPYRYAEETWADDMEWGAAELFRSTGQPSYREDARRYARLAGAVSWMGRDEAGHYQLYPFMNLGHHALHSQETGALRDELAGFYREGLEATRLTAGANPYGVGVPFIWCSNNLVVALVTQGLLYETMTGDTRYGPMVAAHRDWLLGRNPWGVSMFTGLPEGGRFPTQPHLSTTHLTQRPVRGGLVDGPVKAAIFRALRGVALSGPDVYAAFQAEPAVYHDDVMDYATNEPTMDGTASAVLMLALLAAGKS